MLKFRPGRGSPMVNAVEQLSRVATTSRVASDLSLITVLGTVADPRIMHCKGSFVWQCTLTQTHVGAGGNGGDTLDTQLLEVRCLGGWATVGQRLEKGSQVSITGRLLHRPKYVPSTTSYDYRAEILVTDATGEIVTL